MTVYCSNADCIHCADAECTKMDIRVGCDFEYGCEDYSNYMGAAEYQNEYYKCVRGKDGNVYKFKCKGKRVEYRDLILYTSDFPSGESYIEEKTGYWLGNLKVVKDKYEKIVETIKGMPNVRELPDEPEEGGNNIDKH